MTPTSAPAKAPPRTSGWMIFNGPPHVGSSVARKSGTGAPTARALEPRSVAERLAAELGAVRHRPQAEAARISSSTAVL